MMINESDIKEDIIAAEDRGETTGLMEPLLIGETSRHRAPLTDRRLSWRKKRRASGEACRKAY
jgi:hypothetical protein